MPITSPIRLTWCSVSMRQAIRETQHLPVLMFIGRFRLNLQCMIENPEEKSFL
jgi:hypothetical protein